MIILSDDMRPAIPVMQPGRLERIWYDSWAGDGADTPVRKDALVYLPWAYGQEPDRRFPVLYLMHGGGGNAEEMFGGLEGKTPLKSDLDQAFESGRAEPMIVVTPTYLIPGHEDAHRDVTAASRLTHRFAEEFRRDLIPAVDGKYRTLADRRHRAFGGFSMGAECTWNVMADCLQEAAVYLPLSGDYWACGVKGAKDHPVETVDALLAYVKASGVKPEDYRILAYTGTRDIAYEALDPMMREMEKRQPWFAAGKNLFYYLKPEGWHTIEACLEYVSRALPMLFSVE